MLSGEAYGASNVRIVESTGTDETSRFVEGEIRGHDNERLADGLSEILRTLTTKAALSEAVLETRTAWLAVPWAARSAAVERTALELWEAGFRVTFGSSWIPVSDADLAVGTGGSSGELEDFFRGDAVWKVTSHQL